MAGGVSHAPATTINITRPAGPICSIDLYTSKGKYQCDGQKQVKESFHLFSFPA